MTNLIVFQIYIPPALSFKKPHWENPFKKPMACNYSKDAEHF